jgi:membrane-anchored glycerophosphoryl diester phosphodiesterase (GDPDase)
MALLPGISVREALLLALRRLPTMLGALLLVMAGQLGLTMILAVIFGFAHLVGPGAQSLLVGILMGVSLFVTVRLILLAPMIVTRRVSPPSAIRESWLLSRGAFWRILAVILVYALGALVVMIALNYAVGVILTLSAQAVGAVELGRTLIALFQRGVGALLALGLHLLIAALFRQLNDAPIRGI